MLFRSGVGPECVIAGETARAPGRDIRLRIYRPDQRSGLPVVIFCHGSGFVLGSLETHDVMCRALALQANMIVVSVDYRLAPENPYPAAVEDCLVAISWAQGNVLEHGGDPTRLILAGDSAGGTICVSTALRADTALTGQLLLYPLCDPTLSTPSWSLFGEGYLLDRGLASWYWQQYLGAGGSEADPQAVPLTASCIDKLPPIVIVTPGCDPLRDEQRLLERRIRDAGVQTIAIEFPGAIHGFLGMSRFSPLARCALRVSAQALRGLATCRT